MNTEAKASVVFYLLYEELLQRRGGIYEHVVNITPRQKLKSFAIDVNVVENRNLTYFHVPALRRHEISSERSEAGLKEARISRTETGARVSYEPDLEELQRRLRSRHALQFIVEYDVERIESGGEVQVRALEDYYFYLQRQWGFKPVTISFISAKKTL